MQKVETYMSKVGLDSYYDTTLVQKASQKTNQRPSVIILVFMTLMLIFMLTPLGSCFATIVCLVIPAYETYKCIETEQYDQDQRLLTYWVVYAFLYFFDQILSWIFSIVPFYYLIRASILVYVYLPETNGADKLYKNFIKSFFDKYQLTLEKILSPFEDMGSNVKQVVQKNKEE